MNYIFPQYISTSLSEIIPKTSPDAIDFISSMLKWDPNSRPTSEQLLQHPFMSNSSSIYQNYSFIAKTPDIGSVDYNKNKPKTNTISKIGAGLINKGNIIGVGRHKLTN